jgi:hypothetical protein
LDFKKTSIIIALLLLVSLFGFLAFNDGTNEDTLQFTSTGFVQLKEYADDLEHSLSENKLEVKLEYAISAFQKVNQSRNAIMYLSTIETEGMDFTLLAQRMAVMSNNAQDYILTISQNKPLNPERLKKDIADARKIVTKMDYRLIEQGKYKEIKFIVEELNQELNQR